jgi:hypothetical protein
VRVAPASRILYTSHGAHRVDVANIIPPQAPGLLAAQTALASDHGWCPINPDTFESSMVENIHVIGDACIADPMPKAASAAVAQAKQCALALIAAFEGRDAPAAQFESVCYGMLARGMALSIHGRFRSAGGVILETPGLKDPGAVGPEQEAQNADDWYRNIVAGAFGS